MGVAHPYDATVAIWIDSPSWPGHGRLWSHLISDVSIAELHGFADRVGLPRRGFEGDHYDVPEQWYDDLVAAGALRTDSKDLLARLTRAGLRLRKRRGDRGIAIASDVVFADEAVAHVDLIASPNPAPAERVFCASVFVRDAEGNVAVVFSRRRQEWGPPGGWREKGESPLETACRETREETGLELASRLVRPVGYERFRMVKLGHLGQPDGDLMQVYAVDLDVVRPVLSDGDHGVEGVGWVDPAQWRRRCSAQFWWPLAEAVLPDL